MRLLFTQTLISHFLGYKIYNQDKEIVYIVKRKFSFGHLLKIYDKNNNELGTVEGDSFSLTPQFNLYVKENWVGSVTKDVSFFKPRFIVDLKGWQLSGDIFEWEYEIRTRDKKPIAYLSKAMGLTSTYAMTVCNKDDALLVLMLVLAIDCEKSTRASFHS